MSKIKKISLIYFELVRILNEIHIKKNEDFIVRHGFDSEKIMDINIVDDGESTMHVQNYSIGFVLRINSTTAFCSYISDGNDDTDGLVMSTSDREWTYIEFEKYNKHIPKKLCTENELIDLLPDGDSTDLEFQYSTVYDEKIMDILYLEKYLRPVCKNISKHFYVSYNNLLKYDIDNLDKALKALKELV